MIIPPEVRSQIEEINKRLESKMSKTRKEMEWFSDELTLANALQGVDQELVEKLKFMYWKGKEQGIKEASAVLNS